MLFNLSIKTWRILVVQGMEYEMTFQEQNISTRKWNWNWVALWFIDFLIIRTFEHEQRTLKWSNYHVSIHVQIPIQYIFCFNDGETTVSPFALLFFLHLRVVHVICWQGWFWLFSEKVRQESNMIWCRVFYENLKCRDNVCSGMLYFIVLIPLPIFSVLFYSFDF